jgi:hypothetical protein
MLLQFDLHELEGVCSSSRASEITRNLRPATEDDDYSGHTSRGRNVRKRSVEMPAAFKASASATSGASIGSSVSWNVSGGWRSQIRVIECSTMGVRKGIAELSAFVNTRAFPVQRDSESRPETRIAETDCAIRRHLCWIDG